MVSSQVILSLVVLAGALVMDRLFGDPHSVFHPVALLGRFIGWWGRPEIYAARIQRFAGVVFWVVTAVFFSVPFFLVEETLPWFLYLPLGIILLKSCFAWRSLEEHTSAVVSALGGGIEYGREKVRLLVSRDPAGLDRRHILSAGYESMTENLTDSIISPLLFFSVFGLTGAAIFRAANTMDAMVGYRDERERIGWFAARMDDLLNYIPARITTALLLIYFGARGRFFPAVRMVMRDGRKRPGFNGGIVMAAMAGGIGIQFEKPGVYTIGDSGRSLDEAGPEIFLAVRAVSMMAVVIVICTLFLLGALINSTGI